MQKYTLFFAFYLVLLVPCFSQDASILTVNIFQEQINTSLYLQLLDIRSFADFQRGHIRKARNVDYKKPDFEQKVQIQFDKKAPLFIYCFSGGQSEGAKTLLMSLGFQEVYELDGGFANWTAASKPYTTTIATKKPIAVITAKDIHDALQNHDLVLLDFYAEWCGPCKKMSPILEKISKENSKIHLIKIEADKNDGLANKFEVEEIPTYILFKQGRQSWRSTGIVSETEMRGVLE